MEPILENEIVSLLQEAQEDVKSFPRRLQRKHLDEARHLLQEKLVRGLYDDMVMVDQQLRGKGNPKKVLLRNIEDKLEKFDKFVAGQIKATQKLLNRLDRNRNLMYVLFFLLGMGVMFTLALVDQVYLAQNP